jgi:hypothetical protein
VPSYAVPFALCLLRCAVYGGRCGPDICVCMYL